MKRFVLFALVAFTLVACGANGDPITPKYSAETTVGYNSKSGPFNKTKFGVCFGSNC